MSEERKRADLAEELKRFNDIFEGDRGETLSILANVLGGDPGRASNIRALTLALEDHTSELKRIERLLVDHIEELKNTGKALSKCAKELANQATEKELEKRKSSEAPAVGHCSYERHY